MKRIRINFYLFKMMMNSTNNKINFKQINF